MKRMEPPPDANVRRLTSARACALGGSAVSGDSTTNVPLLPSGLYVDEREPPAEPGDLVVLIHGSMDRGPSFSRVVTRLSDVQVLTYDRRGYHRSLQALPLAHTLDEHVEDLFSVLAGRHAVAAGHSYGGTVALAAAWRRPEQIRAVVAYEPPAPWLPWWPKRSAGGSAAGARGPEEAAETFMRRMIGDARWERLPERTRARRRDEGPALIAEMASIRDDGAPFDPAQVSVPTVIARGELAAPHHRRGAEALADLIPGAELVEVEGAGHGCHLTHPDAFAATVRLALERSGLGSDS
jgi:pimeloyl-ACP methyl ester carboxylesterase